MNLTSQLHRLAHAYGVQVASYGMNGVRRHAEQDTILAVLASMGAPVTGLSDVPGALRERLARRAHVLIEPVIVAWAGRLPALELRLAGQQHTNLATATIDLENGEQRSIHHDLLEMPIAHTGSVEGEKVVTRNWETGLVLPLGYHQLSLHAGGRTASALILSAPEHADTTALDPESGLRPGRSRGWGSFLPTFALRRKEDWGCGDYTSLGQLVDWTGDHGGSAVATLPLLSSAFDEPIFEPSPYTPTSRCCWNELYIDPTTEPEWRDSKQAHALTSAASWALEREALCSAELLDYKRLWALKRPVLEAMSEQLHQRQGTRANSLCAFLKERPHVAQYARFRTATEIRGGVWQTWPERMRNGNLRETEIHPATVRFWEYAQWLAHLQLSQVAKQGEKRGTGLLLDLPLGTHSSGYDTWKNPSLFAHGMSAGAPPDDFFVKGQQWGFPPRIPDAERADGYNDLRATLRHHLEHASALRIDHVMSLHRLYWVPRGMDATHGVYVSNQADEQYAVMCIESQRSGTAIVGEDLGTVPRGVRPAMDQHHIRRLRVRQIEFGASTPTAPNPHAVASLNTHDMPTFEAYRKGLDLEDLQSLGLLSARTAGEQRVKRARALSDARKWLIAEEHLAEDAPDEDLILACLNQLAWSPSPLVLVNLEDLWHETRPHNVPGTHHERPNWRRRAKYGPEDFSSLAKVGEAIATLRVRRRLPCQVPDSKTPTLLDEQDRFLFRTGSHFQLHERLGARIVHIDEIPGIHALHWAPGADAVSFLDLTNGAVHSMEPRGDDLWEMFAPGTKPAPSSRRPYALRVTRGHQVHEIPDPAAWHFGPRPPQANTESGSTTDRGITSELCQLNYDWTDKDWIDQRQKLDSNHMLEVPHDMWTDKETETLSERILSFAEQHGATSVVLPAWMESLPQRQGEDQQIADFAPEARLGDPQGAMHLIDTLHRHNIGVLLAWPPVGKTLEQRQSLPGLPDPDEISRAKEVSYLLSSAAFWLEIYHFDGLRIITHHLRDRFRTTDSLQQAAEVLERIQTELAEQHPHALFLTGWNNEKSSSTTSEIRVPRL